MDSTFLTDRTAITVGTVFYAAGLLYGCWSLLFRRRHSRVGGYALLALGWAIQTYGLYLRGQATHSCPIGNRFEVLQFVAWSCTLLYLFVGAAFRTSLLGFLSAGMAVLLGTLSLAVPEWDSAVRVRPFGTDPLVAVHASLALFSYGVLALFALTSAMYLVQHHTLRRKQLGGPFALLPSIVELDHINLRLLGVGVTLLGLALAVAGYHWHQHDETIPAAKLIATIAVWLGYGLVLLQRVRQRWVAQRFAWIGLLLFLAPLCSLWIVNPPRRAPESSGSSPLPLRSP